MNGHGNEDGGARVAPRIEASMRQWARSLSRRVRLWAAGLLAVGALAAQAEEAVPASWIDYAATTGNALQARLSEGGGDLVTRLHAWLETRQARSATPLPVVVRLWISPRGTVERSEFGSLGDVQADADLRAILAASPLPEPPPEDMPQPLVMQLTLQPNPDFDADAAPGG
ncbi:TonB C-terminal domain-containing protein [[Pseudomonas] boreopolis]|uniref:TonB C-terminal domain-containing protein n=1 Tax=Xanthomonas boreopolis TaxID=86183 RepID=UPI003D47B356